MKRLLIVGAVLAALALGGGLWWQNHHAPAPGWQGYVDADYLRVGPTLGGQLVSLAVHRGAQVAAGAPLFAQDDADDRAARDQAAATLAEAQDRLTNLEKAGRETEIVQAQADLADMRATRDRIAKDLGRNRQLLRSGAATRQTVDQQQADLDSAVAHVKASEAKLAQIQASTGRQYEIAAQRAVVAQQRAALAQAEWRLAQRHVTAPAAALVADTYALPGEVAEAGTPVVELLPPGNILVRFFVPETALATIHAGERVAIGCDSCAANLTARISFIAPQPEYTPPVIYSEAAREKLVYLVEARPNPTQAATLKPGQPVGVRVAP
ncbi:MAG TPA: HlyD family efflux transporter periplasmic adaptor subunit [Acetobacteraceae bacterium]|nr:HlyD family efflux transporter periplasmic adaptor subunit [Acetobacteraceae bacterium]